VKEFDTNCLPLSSSCSLKKARFVCSGEKGPAGWTVHSVFPLGGLDAGETIRAAAAREAYEEVGVNIAPENLHYVHTLHSKTEGRTWLGHFFQATIWEGTPSLRELDKHSDLQWMPVTALPSETIPYVRQAILCTTAQQQYSEYGWD